MGSQTWVNKVISTCSYSDVIWSMGEGLSDYRGRAKRFQVYGDHAVYVISKNAANDVMEYYNQQHGMQCSCFRFPPVYGVGPHGTIMVNGSPTSRASRLLSRKLKLGRT